MEPWMLIVVTIILIVLFFGGNLLLKRVYSKNILAAMTSEDFDGFFKILDSFGCKYALRPFDREMMRLSAYIASGRSKAVDEQMQIMLNMRVNKKNKLTIAMRAFYYYVEKKNRHKAYDMIKVVEENGSPDAAKEMRMVASVLLRKEAKYIKEMKAYYDNAQSDDQRGMFAYMLGLQYSYIDDDKNAMKYLKEAKRDLKDTPYEEVIDDLLKK